MFWFSQMWTMESGTGTGYRNIYCSFNTFSHDVGAVKPHCLRDLDVGYTVVWSTASDTPDGTWFTPEILRSSSKKGS